VTAPETQLGGDTTGLCLLGVPVKLVGIQDLGDRERVLFDAFAVDERESAALVERVLADAADGLAGAQFITDQGTPYLADAAKQAYDALGVEHVPQREGSRRRRRPSSAVSAPSRTRSRRSSRSIASPPRCPSCSSRSSRRASPPCSDGLVTQARRARARRHEQRSDRFLTQRRVV
jgi:hypothetical protein